MNEWVSIIRDLGIPTAALVAIGVGLARLAYWFSPRVDRLVDGHCSLMAELQSQANRQTECMESISDGQQIIARTQQEVLELVTELHQSTKRSA